MGLPEQVTDTYILSDGKKWAKLCTLQSYGEQSWQREVHLSSVLMEGNTLPFLHWTQITPLFKLVDQGVQRSLGMNCVWWHHPSFATPCWRTLGALSCGLPTAHPLKIKRSAGTTRSCKFATWWNLMLTVWLQIMQYVSQGSGSETLESIIEKIL